MITSKQTIMRYNIINIYVTAATLLLCSACTDDVLSSGEGGDAPDREDIITVGADIEDEVVVSTTTRAGEQSVDAETIPWLIQPLMKGLDITYGNIDLDGKHKNQRVAILKLLPKEDGSTSQYVYATDPHSGYAKYSFNYRSDETGTETANPALWYDNGPHFFEGVHVPNRLRYKAEIVELATNNRKLWDDEELAAVTNLTTDQHDDTHAGTDNQLGNYTLLAHYLGMPANTRISATVARIKLPFRHRLCRVLAYILIDPDLKTNGQPAKIKGYANVETDESKPFRDDPITSSVRFCNVDVLGGVHDDYNSTTKLHTLTPIWSEKVRKVVPHFQEQLATFKTKESGDKIWFENSSNYASAPSGATEKTYNNVPVYDLIIRPTYTSVSNVMYDEALGSLTKQQYAAKTNQIDFTVSLDNGLTYEKHVTIDLDANYQTIVYLRITHEGVDYNESGSEKWEEKTHNDQWYGVDNQNGNILSQAGSSWQRAFYNTHLGSDDKITDGGFYDEDTSGEDGTSGQYVSDATWIKNFAQAYKGGAHHGDYFVLANDLTIDARSLPDDFVFTGHLDGFNTHGVRAYHTITVTGTNTPWKEYIETTDYTSDITRYDSKPAEAYSNDLGHLFALPEHLYTKAHHDVVCYTQEECNIHNATLDNAWKPGETVKEAAVEEVKYTQEEINAAIAIVEAEDYVEGTNPEAEETATKTTDDVKTPGKPAVYYNETECNAHNADLPNAWTIATIKTEAYDEYIEAHPTLNDVMTGSTEYYTNGDGDTCTKYTKPSVLYTMTQRTSGTALFAGLDGIYETNQERGTTPWEANVHKEGNYWLPYRDVSDPDESKHTGWRAEVLNLTVMGCNLFKSDAVITGNVENCKYEVDGKTYRVADHTPAMPKYK